MDEMSGTNFVRGSRKAKLPKKMTFGFFFCCNNKTGTLATKMF